MSRSLDHFTIIESYKNYQWCGRTSSQQKRKSGRCFEATSFKDAIHATAIQQSLPTTHPDDPILLNVTKGPTLKLSLLLYIV